MRHRLAADEATLVEQPRVGAVELLVAVVRQDGRVDLVGDAQHERVATTDRAGRRRDDLVVADCCIELGDLFGIDAMTEGGVDDDGDQRVGVLRHVGQHRLVELFETGHGSALGGEVRAVDDDVTWHNVSQSITPEGACLRCST